MNLVGYYKSIADEMMSTKDRIRSLMEDVHWLTDGEWKESVLRSVLRRYMPDNVGIGRGFIIGDSGTSRQIDVLLYDKSYPIIFKDGDLVFITPRAVKGFVEVKSTADYAVVESAFDSLTENICFLIENGVDMMNIFVGLFVYDRRQITYEAILHKLKEKAEGDVRKVINHICIGDYIFIKFWESPPTINNSEVREHGINNPKLSVSRWHAYNLKKANVAYFINNLINTCSDGKIDDTPNIWFQYDEDHPYDSKENRLMDVIDLN